MTYVLLAFLVFLSVVSLEASSSSLHRRLLVPSPDFVWSRDLVDGEREVGVRRSTVYSLETSAGFSSPLRLWQVTNGRRFIQSILDGRDRLVDCEFSRDSKAIRRFLYNFGDLAARARRLDAEGRDVEEESSLNETLKLAQNTDLMDARVRHKTDLKRLRNECKKRHEVMKEAFEQNVKNSRKKRDIFIYPGTNYCGVGATTDKYNQLGFNSAADRCCRQHDHCAHIIEGFTTKYNMFNYRLHTVSHCDCDERFRSCLKMVNSASSNMVGKLYFNVLQMRCFVLKPEKSCVRRLWWGKCVKYEMQKSAHLRDALPF